MGGLVAMSTLFYNFLPWESTEDLKITTLALKGPRAYIAKKMGESVGGGAFLNFLEICMHTQLMVELYIVDIIPSATELK